MDSKLNCDNAIILLIFPVLTIIKTYVGIKIFQNEGLKSDA